MSTQTKHQIVSIMLPQFDNLFPPMPTAQERHRFNVIIETILACFTNPAIICDRPCSAIPAPIEWLKHNRMQIELERFTRLFNLTRRDAKPASLDAIRACATMLTNPEKVGVLSVISGEMPLPDEQFYEYARAFAHCIDLDTFVSIFRSDYGEALNLNKIEQFHYTYGGRGNWGYLDDEEREWIKDFNVKFRARCDELKLTNQTKDKE